MALVVHPYSASSGVAMVGVTLCGASIPSECIDPLFPWVAWLLIALLSAQRMVLRILHTPKSKQTR